MTPEIRTFTQNDAGELFRLRRNALLDSPFAFLASPDDDAASSEAAVRELLKPQRESVVFGAYAPALIGMLGLYRASQKKAAHKINLWGMFVLPAFRGQGVAARLLDVAIGYARTFDGVMSIHLSVSESAVAARHLYEKAGFQTWGIEPDAIQFEGRAESERRMRFALGKGS